MYFLGAPQDGNRLKISLTPGDYSREEIVGLHPAGLIPVLRTILLLGFLRSRPVSCNLRLTSPSVNAI